MCSKNRKNDIDMVEYLETASRFVKIFLDWLAYWAERTAGLNSNEYFSFSETVQIPKAPDSPDIMGRKMGWIE